jgi:WD40 repeat protein
MAWPLSQDYNEAIQDPASSFADPELKQGSAATNALGIPMPRSGNFADVYEFTCPTRKWAVKCFTRQIPGIRERYKEISAYLKQTPLPFMVEFAYLEQGIRIRGEWYPVLKMNWVEGFNLNQCIKDNLAKPVVLDIIGQIWVKLAAKLRDAQMAHCDLQHGNVLLVPGSKAGSLAVKLVDYDGMCVPALTLLKTIEVGHPNFQHPQRARDGIYSLEVDRFSHLVIYTATRALITGGKALWDKFDNGDNLLFKAADFEKPTKSPVFAELLRSSEAGVKQLAETMIQALAQPLDQTPKLPDVVAKLPALNVSSAVTRSVPTQISRGETTTLSMDSPVTTLRRPPRKSGLLIGAAVAAVVGLVALVGGGAALFFLMKNDPEPVVAKKEDKKNPPNKDDSGKKNPPNKDDSGKKKDPEVRKNPDPEPKGDAVDLLKMIDPAQHVVSGKWVLANGTLISPPEMFARVQIPYDLPPEYQLTVVAALPRDSREIDALFMGLVAEGRHIGSVVGGWGGEISGLDQLDDKQAANNETTYRGKVFSSGVTSKVIYTVRRTGINISVDGKEIVNWKGDYGRFSPLFLQWRVPNTRRLVLGSHRPYRIKQLSLVPLKSEPQTPDPTPTPSNDARTIALRFKDNAQVELANSAGMLDPNGTFTAEMWVKLPALVDGATERLRLMGDISRGAGWELNATQDNTDGAKWRLAAHFAVEADRPLIMNVVGGNAVPLPPNEWTHVALVKTPENVAGFVNGKMTWVIKHDRRLKRGTFNMTLGAGLTTKKFNGEINAFRASRNARYGGAFTPEKQLKKEADTLVLLDFAGKGESVADLAGKHDGRLVGAEWSGSTGVAVTPSPSDLAQWSHLDISQVKAANDHLRVEPQGWLKTKDSYAGDVEITLVARTAKNNIRLYANNGSAVLFNCEAKPDELRVSRPDGDANKHESGTWTSAPCEPLAPNTWYRLRWRLTSAGTEVFVNDKSVFSEKRNYPSAIKGQIVVHSVEDPVDVKELVVKRLEPTVVSEPSIALRLKQTSAVELANTAGLFDGDEFTVETWLKLPDPAGFDEKVPVWHRLFGDHVQRPTHSGWQVVACRTPTGADKWTLFCIVAGAGGGAKLNDPQAWHHVAAVRKADGLTLYIDGKFAGRSTKSIPQSPSNFSLGRAPNEENNPNQPPIGEFRAFRASSKARYQASFTPPAEFTKDDDTSVLLEFSGKGNRLKDLVAGKHDATIVGADWVSKTGEVAGVPAGPGKSVFLSDLQEHNVKVYAQGDKSGFSKNGRMNDEPIVVDGVKSPHAIFLHPSSDDFSSVSYTLEKSYRLFSAKAAIPRLRPEQKDPSTALTFEVRGDGKSLWKSKPLKTMGESDTCEINVAGVRLLELRVYCPGSGQLAWAVWSEPQLAGTDSTPEPVAGPAARDSILRFKDNASINLNDSVGLLDINGSFTVEMWLKLPPPDTSLRLAGDMSRGQRAGWHFNATALGRRTGPKTWGLGCFFYGDNGPGGGANGPGAVEITPQAWHHFALVKSGADVTSYVDGKAFWTCKTGAQLKPSPLGLTLAASPDDFGSRFNGDIRGFRASSKARYKGEFRPPQKLSKDADTVVLLDFSGAGVRMQDMTGKHDARLNGTEWLERDMPLPGPMATATPDTPAAPEGQLPRHRANVRSLAVSADGKFVATADFQTIQIFDLAARKLVRSFQSDTSVNCVAFSPDGKQLFTGSQGSGQLIDRKLVYKDCLVKVWDIEGGTASDIFDAHSNPINSVSVTADGNRLVSGSKDSIRVWDLTAKKAYRQILLDNARSSVQAVIAQDGRFLLAIDGGKDLCAWQLPSTKLQFRSPSNQWNCHTLALRGDGKVAATAGGAVFSRNGESVAEDTGIRIWNLQKGVIANQLMGHTATVNALAFSKDGRYLASAAGVTFFRNGQTDTVDCTVRIWDVVKRKQIKRFEGHTARIESVAFTPDNQHVISGDQSGVIRIWDTELPAPADKTPPKP